VFPLGPPTCRVCEEPERSALAIEFVIIVDSDGPSGTAHIFQNERNTVIIGLVDSPVINFHHHHPGASNESGTYLCKKPRMPDDHPQRSVTVMISADAITARLAQLPTRKEMWRAVLVGMLGGAATTVALIEVFARS
jgi:hypothetical protein